MLFLVVLTIVSSKVVYYRTVSSHVFRNNNLRFYEIR